MTSKFSIDNRELLQRISSGEAVVGIDFGNLIVRELAAFRLAAMDSEPVAYIDKQWTLVYYVPPMSMGLKIGDKLYRHAQPAPVIAKQVGFINGAREPVLYGEHIGIAIGAQLYAVPQPAPVVPEEWTIADAVKFCKETGRQDAGAAMDAWNACRAAMLQELKKSAGTEAICRSNENVQAVEVQSLTSINPASALDSLPKTGEVQNTNYPAIPDGWTGNDKANAALMMLDRIETADPVDDDRIDGIKRIVRELAAAPHDTPALNSVQSVVTVPGKWIPVSEQMPEIRKGWLDTLVIIAVLGEKDGAEAMYCSDGKFRWGRDEQPIDDVTHWMPLPAAPQEVK